MESTTTQQNILRWGLPRMPHAALAEVLSNTYGMLAKSGGWKTKKAWITKEEEENILPTAPFFGVCKNIYLGMVLGMTPYYKKSCWETNMCAPYYI